MKTITFFSVLIFILSNLWIGFSATFVLAQETLEDADNELTGPIEEDLLTYEEVEPTKPLVEGTHELKFIGRQININARMNPDNKILDLQENRQTITSLLSISDFPDQERKWRWLAKLYGVRLYESKSQSTTDTSELRLDEAFIDGAFQNWFLSLGKRRNSWGPALAFNPVNVVVPPRDPLNPNQQTEGQPAVFVNYATDRIAFDLILTRDYDREWYGRYARWGGRFSIIMDESDAGFYYFDGEASEANEPYPRLFGFSFSSNFLADSTIYIEAANFSENVRNYYRVNGTTEKKEEPVSKVVLGSNTTLDGNTSLLFELYFNSAGYDKEERKNYFESVDAVLNPFPNISKFGVFNDYQFSEMNRSYFLISYRKSDILDQFNFALQILAAADSSSIVEIQGDYNMSDYYKLITTLRHYSGDKNSEFGNSTTTTEAEFGIKLSH